MIVAKLVEIGSKMMKLLSEYDIRMDDYKYIPLFDDYESMLNAGEKITYIVTILQEKYDMSEASVYRILRRFRQAIKT